MNEFRNFFDPTATGDYVKTRKDIVNELKLSGLKPKITITSLILIVFSERSQANICLIPFPILNWTNEFKSETCGA